LQLIPSCQAQIIVIKCLIQKKQQYNKGGSGPKLQVYWNFSPAGICNSVPVPAGTGANLAGIYKSINEMLYVII